MSGFGGFTTVPLAGEATDPMTSAGCVYLNVRLRDVALLHVHVQDPILKRNFDCACETKGEGTKAAGLGESNTGASRESTMPQLQAPFANSSSPDWMSASSDRRWQ